VPRRAGARAGARGGADPARAARAGLLKKQEGGKPAFAALKRAFRLLVDGVDDRAPADIAYAFSGYAPLLVRRAEEHLSGIAVARMSGEHAE